MSDTQARLSQAQTCPEDVLREITHLLEVADAASCALACRNWLLPGRLRLYSSVHLDTSNIEKLGLLLHTLLKIPDVVLPLVRHICVVYERTVPNNVLNDLFSWLSGIQRAPRLLSLTLTLKSYDFEFADTACGIIPALTSLETLALTDRFVDLAQSPGRNILALLSGPALRRASLTFGAPSQFHTEQDVPVGVTWLSLNIGDFPSWLPTLATPSLARSLTRLDVTASVLKHRHKILIEPLRRFQRLTHLVVYTTVGGSPLLHEVVGHLPALRALYAGEGTWNTEMIDALPGTLHSLWLEAAAGLPGARLGDGHVENLAKRRLRALALVCKRPGELDSIQEIAARYKMIFRLMHKVPLDMFDSRLLMHPDGEPISDSDTPADQS